jgi:hypothetical protein
MLVLLTGIPQPVAAQDQFTGRWRLTLESGSRVSLQGELVLDQQNGRPTGVLLLENRDTAWIPLQDQRIDSAGAIHFTAAAPGPLRFEGRLVNQEIEGTATRQSEPPYRWRGVRLRPDEEFYAALPRFRQRQLRIGSDQSQFVVPGRWLAAAQAVGETVAAMRSRYTEVALGAGVTPLPPDSVSSFGLYRAMGLFRREEMNAAAVRTLERIRSRLRSDTSLARFDHLFRPAGSWQLDIHDVARAVAGRAFPTISWNAARPALAAAGLLDKAPAGVESVPLALYRLFTQSRNDTAAFRESEDAMRRADLASAGAVSALLSGYEQAALWYVAAMQFLLRQQWISADSSLQSPEMLVRAVWRSSAPVPEIRARAYGYPEGSVRIGTDSQFIRAVLVPENAPAGDWLRRHGPERLVSMLHQLRVPAAERTVLQRGGEWLRLSSVQEYARESFSGFLEPDDLILLDPSYQPLLALGTVVHEWLHILHERARQALPPAGRSTTDGEIVITQPDPFLAEGMAEWLTEQILAPALGDFPLVQFGEAEKRVSLTSNDPHQLGYLLVRTLAGAVGDPRSTLDLLIRFGSDPAPLVADRRLSRAWSGYRGADRVIPRRGGTVLVPQAVFTVEDGHPDLVESLIISPR